MSPSSARSVTDPPIKAPSAEKYDGTSPFPPAGPTPVRTGGERLYMTVTGAIVVLPFLALGLGVWLLWGSLIHLTDILPPSASTRSRAWE